jgi:hypothetical protein
MNKHCLRWSLPAWRFQGEYPPITLLYVLRPQGAELGLQPKRLRRKDAGTMIVPAQALHIKSQVSHFTKMALENINIQFIGRHLQTTSYGNLL